MINLEKLERLAKESPAEKWSCNFIAERLDLTGNLERRRISLWAGGRGPLLCCNDPQTDVVNKFKYIAAANPETILALVKVARAARDYYMTRSCYSEGPTKDLLRKALEDLE